MDCLAVGTSHGVYVHEPKLDFERLELLNTISDIPMEENDRAIYDQIGGILQFKDYIMYRLTNVFATDLNCFGGAFMVDMNTMDYSKELMKLYGIPELYDALPKLAT